MQYKTTTTVSDEIKVVRDTESPNDYTFTLRYEIEFNNIPPVSEVSSKTLEEATRVAFSEVLLKYKEN